MVILRLSLGCHFLYEGVWKITHPQFSAEVFLTQAKGPAAGIFRAMVPDVHGRERLKVETVIRSDVIRNAWTEHRGEAEKAFDAKLKKAKKPEADYKKLVRQFRVDADLLLWDAEDKLAAALARHEEDVLAYFASLEEKEPADKNVVKKKELPAAIKDLLGELTDVEKQYHKSLAQLTTSATGGNAPTFEAIVPGLGKSATLDKIVIRTKIYNARGKEILGIEDGIKGTCFIDGFHELKAKVIDQYDVKDKQAYDVERLYRLYKASVHEYLDTHQEDIVAYFGSLDRLKDRKAGGNHGASHQKERLWDEQRKLQAEVGQWLGDFDAMQRAYENALWNKLLPDQKEMGSLPTSWTRMDLVNFLVTYGLTAIGLCLLLGLFTRPAAIGGGCFMFFVILTQPAWPSIYPPAPPVAGHALLINKDFIEMVALFLLATTAAGRWAGLDYFVENYLSHWCELCKNKKQKKQEGAQDESDA